MSSRPRLTSEQIRLLLEAMDTQAKALVEEYREVRRMIGKFETKINGTRKASKANTAI